VRPTAAPTRLHVRIFGFGDPCAHLLCDQLAQRRPWVGSEPRLLEDDADGCALRPGPVPSAVGPGGPVDGDAADVGPMDLWLVRALGLVRDAKTAESLAPLPPAVPLPGSQQAAAPVVSAAARKSATASGPYGAWRPTSSASASL
jgi:hypothetical protein